MNTEPGEPATTGRESDPASVEELGCMQQLLAARQRKLAQLRAAGVDPYPAVTPPHRPIGPLVAEFVAAEAEGRASGEEVTVVGRLLGAVRRHGGAAFIHLRDGSGAIQLHLRRDGLGATAYDQFLELYDPGDFVAARGTIFRTRRGEVSVAVSQLSMLAKSLLPLPEKWHGLQDRETRFRQRYLDLVSNAEVRERFVKRTAILARMRDFLDARGFLEVETPILQPLYGGGNARPFTTYYNALEQSMYLRIADELYLKRLLIGGFDRVYEIGKDFRNEGVDRTHLPEFTQMECYAAYADYRDMMALTEEMVAFIASRVNGQTTVSVQSREIELAPPWRRLTVRQAILGATGIDVEVLASLEDLRAAISRAGLDIDPQPTWARTVDELLAEVVEPTLWEPTFLTDYPVALSPLAKRKPEDPRYAERFEAFAAGLELANAFSELNDPLEQRQRFLELAAARDKGDTETQPIDEDFVEALMHGMPPAGGLGVGVDRLVMLLTGQSNIREVVLFPQLRSLD